MINIYDMFWKICKKLRNRNFSLKEFATKYYQVEKKRNDYVIDDINQRKQQIFNAINFSKQ